MTVGMLLATILLVLTFSGVLSGGQPARDAPCSLMGLLVAQGAAGVSGVLRADVQPWTDAALLCASVSTALAEIVRRTAIFLLTPPGVKGGHRG